MRAVNMNFGEEAGFLAQTRDERREPAGFETQQGQRGVLDLDGRMIDVRPPAGEFQHLVAHHPEEEVDMMGCLIDEDAAAFGVPTSAPRVGAVVRLVSPIQHDDGRESRGANLAGGDGRLHSRDGFAPTALADDADGHA